jgi:hypothetical protein
MEEDSTFLTSSSSRLNERRPWRSFKKNDGAKPYLVRASFIFFRRNKLQLSICVVSVEYIEPGHKKVAAWAFAMLYINEEN